MEQQRIEKFEMPIIGGIYSDLTKLDFSFIDIRLIEVHSSSLDDYITEIEPEISHLNLGFVDDIREKDYRDNPNKKYAIVKNNIKEDFDQEDIYNVYRLLLIVYPSDLQIEYIIEFYESDGLMQTSSMSLFDKNWSGHYESDLLMIFAVEDANYDDYNEFNKFSKLYFSRLKNEGYLGLVIENYIASFSASRLHYKYLNLCMALESMISGPQELSYRLRRTVAILCGKSAWYCKHIFNNMNDFYTLRSKIIHGEEYSYDKLIKYLPKLRALVSRVIIELLIHNIETNVELNDIVTKIGFGERKKISKDWQHFDLNITTWVETNVRSID